LTDATPLLRLLAATLAVGVLPGALVTLLWKPRSGLTMLEIVGYGGAISFGIVQLLTIVAISAHLSPGIILALSGAGCVAIAAVVIYRRPPGVAVHPDELILGFLLVVLAAFLYRLGSPVEWFEDQVHAAIVRRLSALATPRLDQIYFTPGIVYTYPFPGIHYFMALVARLSDLDPLFVYHKLRFFWGPAAVLMLYLAARAAFGPAAFACGTAITALALVFSGAFGMVPGFRSGWGQLIPFSHASDVAMTVLLPALLVMGFGYLLAASKREKGFFLTGSAMLVVMLTIVHIREVVQVAAYLGCFLVVTLAMRRFRRYARRTAIMLALVVSIAAVYTLWIGQVVERTADVVADQRARLASIAATSSAGELLFTPAPALLDEFVLNSELLFVNLTPLFLFAGPAVLILFRGRPLVWLAVVSTAVYLLVMTVPLLAIPYIYVTYFEILFSPVRNVIFFAYLFAGAAIYAVVAGLDRLDRTRVAVLLAGVAAGGLALLVALSINLTASGFVVPLLGGYVLALMVAPDIPRWGMNLRSAVAAALVLVGCVALWPQRDPAPRVTQVAVRWSADLSDRERAALERQFSLTDGEPNSNRTADVNVWNYALANTGADNVRALVTHSRVVDTGGIERDTYVVPPQPPPQDDPYLAVQRIPLVQYPGRVLFLAAALFVWAIGFLVPVALALPKGQRVVAELERVFASPFHTRIASYACFMIPFALLTARPTLSPVSAAGAPDAATPSGMVAAMPCLTTDARPAPYSEDLLAGEAVMLPERTSCPPTGPVVEWIRNHVPVDAVFAIDRWNPYLPSVFVPQQVVVYPQVEVTFENEDQLFADYYRFYSERLRASGVQPFFNSVETPMQRAAFVEALGVTHVLVDPAYYREMRAVLDGLPDEYALRFTEGEWAVYEVLRPRTVAQPRV
jgi:hypothetical protein